MEPPDVFMLRRIEAENFRCFRELDVPLRPLTVLVGANDTGKSNFLTAVQRLVSTARITDGTDHWRHEENRVVLKGTTGEGTAAITSDEGGESIKILAKLHPVKLVQLPSSGVNMESEGHGDEQGTPEINQDGSGTATLLDYMLRKDRKRFFQALKTVRDLVPGLDDLDITTPSPSKRRLDLVVENGFHINGNSTSTGVRFLLAFVALAYHPSPPKVILLEEPETGIHPKRLADVVKLLREITQGKHGAHPAQVILTTHSPYLLDLVNLQSDQVLVFRRQEDGSRTAEPADTDRLRLFLDEFLLGEVWYNQGEEGLLTKQQC